MFQVKKLSKSEFFDMLTDKNKRKPYRTNWIDILKEFDESNEDYCEIVSDEYSSSAAMATTIQQVSNRYFYGRIQVTMVGSRVVLSKQ